MTEVDLTLSLGLIAPWVGMAIQHFHYNANMQERIGKLETKVDLFWGALEEKLPSMLLKGNPIEEGTELYDLLYRKEHGTLTSIEERRLKELLECGAGSGHHDAGEEVAIILMALALKVKGV